MSAQGNPGSKGSQERDGQPSQGRPPPRHHRARSPEFRINPSVLLCLPALRAGCKTRLQVSSQSRSPSRRRRRHSSPLSQSADTNDLDTPLADRQPVAVTAASPCSPNFRRHSAWHVEEHVGHWHRQRDPPLTAAVRKTCKRFAARVAPGIVCPGAKGADRPRDQGGMEDTDHAPPLVHSDVSAMGPMGTLRCMLVARSSGRSGLALSPPARGRGIGTRGAV